MSIDITKMLKESEAAKVIGMSKHWLRRKRWEGGGPKYIKMGAGQSSAVRYREDDLLSFLATRGRASTSQIAREE